MLLTKESVYNQRHAVSMREKHLKNFCNECGSIVNANDAISVDEDSYGNFGDNDTMSADVATLVEADLLIMMSDIEGLYTDDPRTNPATRFVHTVNRIDEELEKMEKEPEAQSEPVAWRQRLRRPRLQQKREQIW